MRLFEVIHFVFTVGCTVLIINFIQRGANSVLRYYHSRLPMKITTIQFITYPAIILKITPLFDQLRELWILLPRLCKQRRVLLQYQSSFGLI